MKPLLGSLAAVALLTGSVVRAEGAYDQLVEMCKKTGGTCNPTPPKVPEPTSGYVPPPPSQPTSKKIITPPAKRAPAPSAKPKEPSAESRLAVGLTGGLFNSIFSSLFDDDAPAGPDPAEVARQEQQRIAELQARAALVTEQRAVRDAEQSSNLEAMAAAMSVAWDGAPPQAAAPPPVALQGTQVQLFAPPENPLEKPKEAPNPKAERLARLAAEDGDVALLTSRLGDLEKRLAAEREEADLLKRSALKRVEAYQQMEAKLGAVIEEAKERGMGMAFEGLFLGNAKAVKALSEVQASGRPWREMKQLLGEAHEGLSASKELAEKGEQLSDDAAFLARKREFKEDLTYLAERFGGNYASLGKDILASAAAVKFEFDSMKRDKEQLRMMEEYASRLRRVHQEMSQLSAQVRQARIEVAKKAGITVDEVQLPATPSHRGLGAEVPIPVE